MWRNRSFILVYVHGENVYCLISGKHDHVGARGFVSSQEVGPVDPTG
jgi:hypothetical protein